LKNKNSFAKNKKSPPQRGSSFSPSRGRAAQPTRFIEGMGADKSPEFQIPKSWRVVAGTHAINEVFLVRKAGIQQVWLQQGWESSAELRELNELCKTNRITVDVKPKMALERMCHSHQGAVAIVSTRPELDMLTLAEKSRSIIAFLDGIEDPHNLGAIMRTAWLFGVDAVYTPEDRAVGLTATVHKVACGGVEHVPLVQENQFTPPIEQLKQQGYWVFGLSHKSKKSLYELKLPEKVVWMVGAEDKGLRTSSERLCDELVCIPQASAAASYNASVATAIALAETYRQQKGR